MNLVFNSRKYISLESKCYQLSPVEPKSFDNFIFSLRWPTAQNQIFHRIRKHNHRWTVILENILFLRLLILYVLWTFPLSLKIIIKKFVVYFDEQNCPFWSKKSLLRNSKSYLGSSHSVFTSEKRCCVNFIRRFQVSSQEM